MKLKKVISIIFLIVFLAFFTVSYTNAVEGQSMELSLAIESREYQVGDIISVNVYIDEITGFSGINTFVAKKEYDSETLEYIETIVSSDNWELVGDGSKIVLRKMEGEDLSKGKLCTIKYKVLKKENTTVQLSEVDACNDDGDVYYEDGNVNSPSIEVVFEKTTKNNTEGKSYIGIVLITIGILGLVGVVVNYMLNKSKQ